MTLNGHNTLIADIWSLGANYAELTAARPIGLHTSRKFSLWGYNYSLWGNLWGFPR